MRSILASLLLAPTLFSCTADGVEDDGGADLAGQDEKGDAVPGIEVQARLRPGTRDAAITTAVPRPGFVFYAAEGTKVTVEVTHGGTTAGLDTLLKVYGPRLADGSYPKTIATDEDSGYGKMSKASAEISIPGFYLVELTNGAAATPAVSAKARLKLSCSGTCDSDQPVSPPGLDLRWFQRSAERHALSLQAYGLATAKVEARHAAGGLPASWGVVMDIDETTLNNSAYQKARSELGTGYSPGSWKDWVDQKAATPIDGALAFTKKVKALGGKVVFVTNRMDATECPATQANLTAAGFTWDGMHCKTTTSDKNPRFDTVKQNMEIVAFVGDNILDFPALSQDLRKQPEAAYASFGEKFFIIPNPMYGSFEKNAD